MSTHKLRTAAFAASSAAAVVLLAVSVGFCARHRTLSLVLREHDPLLSSARDDMRAATVAAFVPCSLGSVLVDALFMRILIGSLRGTNREVDVAQVVRTVILPVTPSFLICIVASIFTIIFPYVPDLGFAMLLQFLVHLVPEIILFTFAFHTVPSIKQVMQNAKFGSSAKPTGQESGSSKGGKSGQATENSAEPIKGGQMASQSQAESMQR